MDQKTNRKNTAHKAVIPQANKDRLARPAMLSDPIIILAPPRSFTSVVGAMIGQHPQLYGLPELQLFVAESMHEWWEVCSHASFPMAHGLLRATAQLYFGEQTEETVIKARAWLRRRSHFSTGMIVEQLAERVHPLILVDKSPSTIYRIESMQRAYSMFPCARFIHLVRHPRGQGESVMKAIWELSQSSAVPQWLIHLASFPRGSDGDGGATNSPTGLDPQNGWYILNMKINKFLQSVPDDQQIRIRGEDLLNNPEDTLQQITGWLGLRSDSEAIEEMKHPERSPYASYGPPGARLGNDGHFLHSPALRPERARYHRLDGPLSWRKDGGEFHSEVRDLAIYYGYE